MIVARLGGAEDNLLLGGMLDSLVGKGLDAAGGYLENQGVPSDLVSAGKQGATQALSSITGQKSPTSTGGSGALSSKGVGVTCSQPHCAAYLAALQTWIDNHATVIKAAQGKQPAQWTPLEKSVMKNFTAYQAVIRRSVCPPSRVPTCSKADAAAIPRLTQKPMAAELYDWCKSIKEQQAKIKALPKDRQSLVPDVLKADPDALARACLALCRVRGSRDAFVARLKPQERVAHLGLGEVRRLHPRRAPGADHDLRLA
jgi:hypothetical protein